MYKSREQVVTEMLAELTGMIPDVYAGDDGVIRIVFEVQAGQFENAFLANQLVLNDMFIATASLQGLIQHGTDLGVPMKVGTFSTGTITFEGQGGVYVPVNTEVAYNAGAGVDPMYFLTTADGTIPNPGTPSAPTVAAGGAGGLTGTYEYRVTFVTASGETLPSVDSAPVVPSAQQVNISNIPIGGVGTIQRNIYRDKNGAGDYRLVGTINDNTTTTFTDNVSDATVAGNAQQPATDTAHRITVAAQSQDIGADKNILANTITELSDAPASLTGITASSAFTGGTDGEDIEDYRSRLLASVQAPATGSAADIKSWAESISGVESASVFPNDNMGTPTNGHVTVRIAGPDGSTPSAQTISDVLAYLQSKDMANVTLHVTTFTPVSIDVTVDVTADINYTLSDVSDSVTLAVQNYINGLSVGETAYKSGIIAAVKLLPGVADVVVTNPASNVAGSPTQKFVPGTISVI